MRDSSRTAPLALLLVIAATELGSLSCAPASSADRPAPQARVSGSQTIPGLAPVLPFGVFTLPAPTGPFAAPCDEILLEREVPRLLQAAGWQVAIQPSDNLGRHEWTVAKDGISGNIELACGEAKDVYFYCVSSEDDYTVAASTSIIMQLAASFELVDELLHTLEPHMGPIHCTGTDQLDLEWSMSRWSEAVRLTLEGDACSDRAGFRVPSVSDSLFASAHAAVPPGTEIEWVDRSLHVLDRLTVTPEVTHVEATPDCAAVRSWRAE